MYNSITRRNGKIVSAKNKADQTFKLGEIINSYAGPKPIVRIDLSEDKKRVVLVLQSPDWNTQLLNTVLLQNAVKTRQ